MKHHTKHEKNVTAKEHKDSSVHRETKKKSNNLLKILLAAVVLTVIAVVLVLGYFGYVPGLSDLMGANKPKDLGIRYTQEDLLVARQKANFRLADERMTPSESVAKYGKVAIDKPFTQEELTALANDPQISYYPIKDVQIRINPDDSVEVSGRVETASLEKTLKDRNFPSRYADVLNDYKNVLPPSVSVYYKGRVEVKDGKLDMDFDELEVGKINVSKDVLNNIDSELTQVGQGRMDYHEIKTENARFEDGKFNYEGEIPKVQSDMAE